jgi:hypothetical protein
VSFQARQLACQRQKSTGSHRNSDDHNFRCEHVDHRRGRTCNLLIYGFIIVVRRDAISPGGHAIINLKHIHDGMSISSRTPSVTYTMNTRSNRTSLRKYLEPSSRIAHNAQMLRRHVTQTHAARARNGRAHPAHLGSVVWAENRSARLWQGQVTSLAEEKRAKHVT